jgi:hypothetical protein
LIAEAAAEHASNANLVLLDGLAALGELMYVAGANLENRVSTESWAGLGCLVQHVAVEALFAGDGKCAGLCGAVSAGEDQIDAEGRARPA